MFSDSLSISIWNSFVWTWKSSSMLDPISHTQIPPSRSSKLETYKKRSIWQISFKKKKKNKLTWIVQSYLASDPFHAILPLST